jgi:hypothetical protein
VVLERNGDICCTNRVRNVESIANNQVGRVNNRKATWTDLTLRRECILKHVMEETIKRWIEVTEVIG